MDETSASDTLLNSTGKYLHGTLYTTPDAPTHGGAVLLGSCIVLACGVAGALGVEYAVARLPGPWRAWLGRGVELAAVGVGVLVACRWPLVGVSVATAVAVAAATRALEDWGKGPRQLEAGPA